MDKKIILDLIIGKLQDDLERIANAVDDAHAVSTDEANIPENKYDTLALEASYLEQGQSQRMIELENSIKEFMMLRLQAFTNGSQILLSALVALQSADKQKNFFFFGPAAGGVEIKHKGKTVTVITPASPIGKAVLGKKQGDQIEVSVAGQTKKQTICDIW